MKWYLQVLRKYAVFSGRARRLEYWTFVLTSTVVSLVLTVVDMCVGTWHDDFGVIASLYSLAVLVPGLAVAIRRLHDTGRSGWWALLAFVPILGVIVLFVFALMDGEPGTNRYGANPKDEPEVWAPPAGGVDA
jgi:uncharacterized membrane protein YhaH (DUF805 family)